MKINFFFERNRRVYERYPLLFQLLGWGVYLTLPYFVLSSIPLINYREMLPVFAGKLMDSLIGIVFFYLNYLYITPYVLKTKKLYLLVLALCVAIFITLFFNIVYFNTFLGDYLTTLNEQFPQPMRRSLGKEGFLMMPPPFVISSFITLFLLTSISSGLAVYKDRNQHKAQSQQMILEKKEAELLALKLQISPHFLFNTLNNMRWLARQKSDLTEEAIIRLSDLMRYMIYQGDKGPVPLEKEIEYLENYIELQRMRLAPNNQVEFTTSLDNSYSLIEPLLFIHFIENAFKHGLHNELNSEIVIQLALIQGKLTFSTRNRMFKEEIKSHATDSGIGIQNIERRLKLHYPERHLLRIYHNEGFFCVDLTISLSQP